MNAKSNFQRFSPFTLRASQILLLLIFNGWCSYSLIAQTDPLPVQCGMDETSSGQTPPAGQEPNSIGQYCTTVSNTVYADLPRYMPAGERIKLRANFIILQRQDGTGNFQDIPEHRAFLDDWFNKCNEVLDNTWWSSQSGCLPPASSTEIEIIPNWLFLPDPSGIEKYWNLLNQNTPYGCPNATTWWLNELDDIINANPAIPRGINVYFTIDADVYHQLVTLQTIDDITETNLEYVWCSEQPIETNLTRPSRINVANLFLKYYWFQHHENVVGAPFTTSRAWIVNEGRTLAHELGHSFIKEYVHYNGCTSHLMANTDVGQGRSFRELDLQYVHRGLVYNNLRQFIDCDTRYNASMYSADREWNITATEEWTRDMRLYHNLRVSAGATLTIRCKLLLPEDGVVIVERGAKLIVNGGQIWRANTCTSSEYWAGMAVKGNPDLPQPDPNGPITANQAGVVLLMGNGEIEGAVVGVVTQSHPHWDVPADRGGLVKGHVFTFRNNLRGVQFMRYDLANFSEFKKVKFLTDNTTAKWGVTMWATNNILFEGCTFQNLLRNGISSYDASYTVLKQNQFINCANNGISAQGSIPLFGSITVGTELNVGSDQNTFVNNTVGFRGSATVLSSIQNNYMDNFDFDVAITGESSNLIRNNLLGGNAAGIQLESTGFQVNTTDCNQYENNLVGISIVSINTSTNFFREKFDSDFHDLFIQGTAVAPGRLPFQGASGNARWNYFTSTLVERIKSSVVVPWDHTTTFNYFYPSISPNPNVEPSCATNDQTSCSPTSNFLKFPTTGGNGICGGGIPGPIVCPDMPCLDSIRQAIAYLESLPVLSDSLQATLQQLIARREHTMVNWLNAFVTAQNWQAAKNLVTSDPNPINRRRYIGIALWKNDFQLADSLIRAFPNQLMEDRQFTTVQTINMGFLSDTNYVLSTQDESTLTEIAMSGTTQAGYAQALLSILTGVDIMPQLPEIEEFAPIIGMPEKNIESREIQEIEVYPIPASEQLAISWNDPIHKNAVEHELTVIDAVTGKPFYSEKFYGARHLSINVSSWPPGLYLLHIRNSENGNLKLNRKIVIQ